MKVKLQAGAELDVISPAEARELVANALHEAREHDLETNERSGESGLTDGNGNAVVTVYTVPVGMEFALHRLVILADGFTPGAPFKNGVGWIDVMRSGEPVDFVNLQNGIPTQSIDSKVTANRWRNGEQLQVALNGGPPNTSFRVNYSGVLRRAKTGAPGRTRRLGSTEPLL